VHVAGVIARGLEAGELVALTDAMRHRRRVEFLPVERASPWLEESTIFVPADHLVCPGSHEIVMV
jgi:hypothetical protein